MARHKDFDWSLPENSGTPHRHEWDSVHAALLMDIRDRLNVRRCGDFLDIPYKLDRVVRNTTKRRERKPDPWQRHRAALRKVRSARGGK